MSLKIPPIKCQGIKTKLFEKIYHKTPKEFEVWYEPFMGSGVVGFNINPKRAIFGDTNPYLINFYNNIKDNSINSSVVRSYLTKESEKLMSNGDLYYKEVRNRFNKEHHSLDFLFLNRSCFNGMIRFNSKGEFNVPFCKKPNRFSKAYITKICNQIDNVSKRIKQNEWIFICDTFSNIISKATDKDLIYCDPPYIDRYADYYNKWKEEDERKLFASLSKTKSKFIMSSWYHNRYRRNIYIDSLWGNFNIDTYKHFYHLGALERNRNEIAEVLISNF